MNGKMKCTGWLLAALHLFVWACAARAAPPAKPAAKAKAPAPPVLKLKDDYRSPRNSERAIRKSTRLIVLHTTEAHAKSSLNKLCERGEAHYCVTEDGSVYRIVDREREAFHAGRSMWNGKEDCDEFSIGIEVVGHHDKPVTLQQIDALKLLLDRLKKIYSLKDAQVVCHSHVAYGAPNTWHKTKHRGRKRCGMLFAMASVRARLGLKARPANDPDVTAKRLVQADAELATVLYGSRDTMAAHYTALKPVPAVAAKKPAAPAAAPKKPAAPPAAVAAKQPATPKPAAKPAPAGAAAAKKPPPPPIVKQQLIVPKVDAKPAEEEEGILSSVGGWLKSTAKIIVPHKKAKPVAEAVVAPPAAPVAVNKPLPPKKQILSRDPRDLEALEALPGYVKGGPVSAELSPYKIAGAAWKDASTYYYMNGRIVTGDKVNEKFIEKGAFVFYKK